MLYKSVYRLSIKTYIIIYISTIARASSLKVHRLGVHISCHYCILTFYQSACYAHRTSVLKLLHNLYSQLLIHLARARDDVACVSYIMSNQRALHMGLQSAKFCIYSNQRVFIHMDSDPLNSIYISKLKNYQKHNKTNIHENH